MTLDISVDTCTCGFQIIWNITEVNKYFYNISNAWIGLPMKTMKSNVQQIKIISQYTFSCLGMRPKFIPKFAWKNRINACIPSAISQWVCWTPGCRSWRRRHSPAARRSVPGCTGSSFPSLAPCPRGNHRTQSTAPSVMHRSVDDCCPSQVKSSQTLFIVSISTTWVV